MTVEHYRDFPGGGPKGLNRITTNMDEQNAFAPVYGALIKKASDQSVAAFVSASVAFATTTYDDASFVAAAGPASGLGFIIPAGFVYARFSANLSIQGGVAAFSPQIQIFKNGALSSEIPVSMTDGNAFSTTDTVGAMNFHTQFFKVTAADYFWLQFVNGYTSTPTSTITLKADLSGGGGCSWFCIEGRKQ